MTASFTAIDIETTGLDPLHNRIIELGAVKMEQGREISRFSMLLKPGIPLPENIVRLTGITGEMLSSAGEPKEGLEAFYDYIGEDVLLGHNVLFDYSFLKTAYAAIGRRFERKGLDTLKLARRFCGDLPGRSLSALCREYGITNPRAHRAADDAKAAGELYFLLAGRFLEGGEAYFEPETLMFRVKKESPATEKQKNYLIDLMKCHKIETQSILGEKASLDGLTKSEASRLIDSIILRHGRIVSRNTHKLKNV